MHLAARGLVGRAEPPPLALPGRECQRRPQYIGLSPARRKRLAVDHPDCQSPPADRASGHTASANLLASSRDHKCRRSPETTAPCIRACLPYAQPSGRQAILTSQTKAVFCEPSPPNVSNQPHPSALEGRSETPPCAPLPLDCAWPRPLAGPRAAERYRNRGRDRPWTPGSGSSPDRCRERRPRSGGVLLCHFGFLTILRRNWETARPRRGRRGLRGAHAQTMI